MIKWQKYFDKIICIHYSGFKKRKPMMETELKRVGILDCPVFEWEITYDDFFEGHFNYMVNGGGNNWTRSRTSCILGHNDAIKRAYYTGCKNVLIIEDDERFLKDLNRVEQILEAKPDDSEYDVLQFDKLAQTYSCIPKLKRDGYKINDQYSRFDFPMYSAGCYCLSRSGMEIILSLYDANDIAICDAYFNYKKLTPILRRVCSITCLSIQVIFSKSQSSLVSQTSDQDKKKAAIQFCEGYKYQEINLNDYMLKTDGSLSYYGDVIEE